MSKEIKVIKDSEVPCLEIPTGYLSWFRGYRAQVSGDTKGNFDNGSSPTTLEDDMEIFGDLFKKEISLLPFVSHCAYAINASYSSKYFKSYKQICNENRGAVLEFLKRSSDEFYNSNFDNSILELGYPARDLKGTKFDTDICMEVENATPISNRNNFIKSVIIAANSLLGTSIDFNTCKYSFIVNSIYDLRGLVILHDSGAVLVTDDLELYSVNLSRYMKEEIKLTELSDRELASVFFVLKTYLMAEADVITQFEGYALKRESGYIALDCVMYADSLYIHTNENRDKPIVKYTSASRADQIMTKALVVGNLEKWSELAKDNTMWIELSFNNASAFQIAKSDINEYLTNECNKYLGDKADEAIVRLNQVCNKYLSKL